MPGVPHRNTAQGLDPFGEGVDEFELLPSMLVQHQVQLVKVAPRISQWCFL